MISRVGCLQTGLFSLPRIWPLELHWPRAPMDSTGRWYVASDVWHPTLFRSGVQCTAHRTTHTHRRLDCRSRTRTRKPLHSSPPSPQLPQPPSHHGPLVFLGCAFPATAPPPSTPPSPHTALARSPRRPPRRVAHSPPPPARHSPPPPPLSRICVWACSHMHPNASVFTSEIAPMTCSPRAPRGGNARYFLRLPYRCSTLELVRTLPTRLRFLRARTYT